MKTFNRKDIRYGLGLDIGIASVGWCVVALNEADEPCGIVDMGVRAFDKAENPKDGASLALPRREARSARRRARRRAHRKERIRSLLVKEGLLSQGQLERLFDAKGLKDIYELRAEGLGMPLSPEEFARVLIHLSQRRGFKSNRKADDAQEKSSKKSEDGKLLTAVSANRERMVAGGWKSVGEMYARDSFYAHQRRNKDGQYLSTVHRDLVAEEARLLFASQRAQGQTFASEVLEEGFLNILLGQRSFDEGPGDPSPYGGSQVEKMRGNCRFEKGEKRAPKASYSFEQFRFWEKANHLRILTLSSSRPLTPEEKQLIMKEAHAKERLDYRQLRKLLALEDGERFNDLSYHLPRAKLAEGETLSRAEVNKACEKKLFAQFQKWHVLRKALDMVAKNHIFSLTKETLDDIAEVLSCYKQDDAVRQRLMLLTLTQDETDALMVVPSFSGFGHLSIKALGNLLPSLEQGSTYDKACAAAGYDFRGHGRSPQFTLPPDKEDMEQITSPVVRRAVAQTIKVVNAVIRLMEHSPVFVNIELAREMAKDFRERREMQQGMEDNAARNEGLMRRLRDDFGVRSPTGFDLVKLKLYEEQQGKCAYTLEPLDIRRLFEPGYAEVDHIIPYSICFDDRYTNKVLVSSKANRDKGNRLPLQYLEGEARNRFMVYTQNAPYRGGKRRNLLKSTISEEDRRQFKERNLQDTKHMSRFLYNYISDFLLFEDFASGRKKHVTAVGGGITAHLRKRWGLSKVRDEGDGHHALDAAVIACTTDGMIASISRYYQHEEEGYEVGTQGTHSVHIGTGEIFPLPWPGFRDDVKLRMEAIEPAARLEDLRKRGRLPSYDSLPPQVLAGARPLFVSRMPQRKVSGPAHKDTIKGRVSGNPGLVVKRVPLEELQLKDGEILNYCRPRDDPALYAVLRDRLLQHGGDAKHAFAEPVCKPGSTAPVRKVKLVEPATLSVPVHGGKGLADNGSMVRIDIFHVKGDGYYLVPIYVADTVKAELPSKACVAHKAYENWKPMKDGDFLFSLYPNDLILLKDREPIRLKRNKQSKNADEGKLPTTRTCLEGEPVYYRGCNIASGNINGCSHDNAYTFEKGLKRLQSIRKFQVDMLGRTSEVISEKRMGF